MTTQKAYQLHSYEALDRFRLEDVSMPSPGASQVLVAVSMVGVNPFDWKLRDGHLKDFVPLQLPATLGADFVGEVVALGEGTSRLRLHDRVMAISTSLGAYAEYIVVEEDILAKVPDELSDKDAATLPMPAITAWQALGSAGDLHPGMTVLIHGASGTVGAFAVQFAKAKGARVIGTASAKNRQYVLDLGADQFIDYQSQRFEELVKDVDLVLDCVLVGGVNSTTDRSWQVLKPNGAVVSIADPSVVAKTPHGYRSFFPTIEADATCLEDIAKELVAGKLKTKTAMVFDRAHVNEAIDMNKVGGTTGRLMVDFKQV